jgi:hypothetical protein
MYAREVNDTNFSKHTANLLPLPFLLRHYVRIVVVMVFLSSRLTICPVGTPFTMTFENWILQMHVDIVAMPRQIPSNTI